MACNKHWLIDWLIVPLTLTLVPWSWHNPCPTHQYDRLGRTQLISLSISYWKSLCHRKNDVARTEFIYGYYVRFISKLNSAPQLYPSQVQNCVLRLSTSKGDTDPLRPTTCDRSHFGSPCVLTRLDWVHGGIPDAAKFVKFNRPTSFPVIRYGDVW